MPTRQDVDLARAAIDRGFLSVQESIKCLEIQRDYEQEGRTVPLEHIFIEAEFLTHRQLATLKESLAKTAALRHIGRFEIISKVGAGGMGTVYKAKDTTADRIVALKVLSPGHASNKEYIARFLREAHASGQLSHPNIVQGYDAGEANGQYYFAMEFVDGTTVADMLKEGRAIPEQQTLDIAIQTAKALQHAEEHNLVHRDVKPDNIMITKDGTAKLADLGLARLTTGDPAKRDKKAFGTPYYASPEQCQGEEELDSKTDMYSFGATLFHMLAGRVPFDDELPEGIMAKHLTEKPPYLKDLNVQLSHGVSKIVRKLMAKQKRDRYPAMAEVVRDLTLVRMGRSPRLGQRSRYDSGEYRYRSATGSWRTKRPSRRKRIIQISACAGLGLFIILGAVLLSQFVGSGSPPPKPKDRGSNGKVVKPQPPPKQPHELYLEEVLKQGRDMPREALLAKLRSVAEKYPGTESAKKAGQRADEILIAMEEEAKPIFGRCKSEALKLRDQRRFHDALKALDEFPARYGPTRYADEVAKLRKALENFARSEFRKTRREAKKLEQAKDYDGAIALFRSVTQTFGIPKMTSQSLTEIRRLEKAKKEEKKREAERARAENRRRLAKQDLDTARAAVGELPDLVADARFLEAADKLKTAAGKLTFDTYKPPLERAAEDLAALQALFDRLKSSRKNLEGKAVVITPKKGVRLEGKIFSVNSRRLSLECLVNGTKAIRTLSWKDLSPSDLRALAELNAGGKPSRGERCAIAALFYFSGRAKEAKAELDKLAADEQGKKAAELRRRDFEFFAKKEGE